MELSQASSECGTKARVSDLWREGSRGVFGIAAH